MPGCLAPVALLGQDRLVDRPGNRVPGVAGRVVQGDLREVAVRRVGGQPEVGVAGGPLHRRPGQQTLFGELCRPVDLVRERLEHLAVLSQARDGARRAAGRDRDHAHDGLNGRAAARGVSARRRRCRRGYRRPGTGTRRSRRTGEDRSGPGVENQRSRLITCGSDSQQGMAVERGRGRTVRQSTGGYADQAGPAGWRCGRPGQDGMPAPPLEQVHLRGGTGPERGHLPRPLHRDRRGRRAITQAEEGNTTVRGRTQVIRGPVDGSE